MVGERGGIHEESVTIRLSRELIELAEALVPAVNAAPPAPWDGAITRSAVLRMALDRGLHAMDEEYRAHRETQVFERASATRAGGGVVTLGTALLMRLLQAAADLEIETRPFSSGNRPDNHRLKINEESKGFLWAYPKRRFLRLHLWEPNRLSRPPSQEWAPLREQGRDAGPEYSWSRVQTADELDGFLDYVRGRVAHPR